MIFFFLNTAYIVFQAHNFIPHHHDVKVAADHHHDDHNDNDDHHDYPFADLTHNADFGKVVVKPQTLTGVDQPVFSTECFIELFDRAALFKTPPLYHPPDNDSTFHCIFLSHSIPLRAPPEHTIMS